MSEESILVIGATGTIGQVVVRRLVEKEKQVKAATRFPERYPAQPQVTPAYFDYTKQETYAPAMKNASKIFALTGTAGMGLTRSFEPFIEQAKLSGIKHMVVCTTVPMLRPDGKMHVLDSVECPLIDSGIPYTLLRIGWLMQSFYDTFFFSMIQEDGVIRLPAEDARIALIDGRDIGRTAAAVLTEVGHHNKAYPMIGNELLSLADVAAIISQVSGRTVRYEHTPLEDRGQNVVDVGGGVEPYPIEELNLFFSTVRLGGYAHVASTVKEITKRPPTKFVDFAHEHASVWRQ
ncbi:MAG: NmrA family NAD(P)-binding protein [Chloroflexota bacterium]